MLKKCFFSAMVLWMSVFSSMTWADEHPPSCPFRIGGTVTINRLQLTNETDDGYIFTVTDHDGNLFLSEDSTAGTVSKSEDTDGLNDNSSNFYSIDIPLCEQNAPPKSEETEQKPEETKQKALLHVYKDLKELNILFHIEHKKDENKEDKLEKVLGAEITLGKCWHNKTIDIIAITDMRLSISALKSLTGQFDSDGDLSACDINGDQRIGMEEAIFMLRKLAGE
ncbi:MAG: hypothetical protein BWK80_08555 [Desulfobacteraceae bacterium IS3]|nr:MAG: hypothetical protein BWK80_08555 [Desulfobacteraceae bacterium IS3]